MTYSQKEINLIILSTFENLTYADKMRITGNLSDGCDFTKCRENLIKRDKLGVYNKMREDFGSEKYRAKILEKLEKLGVVCVTYFSDGYPQTLKQIPDPPIALFCKGDISLLKTRCFTIVGSRGTANSALTNCTKVAQNLTDAFTIVTGIAHGADSAAVEGAIKSGKIICVLAGGFNNIYPADKADMCDEVSKKGLLITEYAPHVPSQSYNFHARNRILAGLSEGTLVVSAGERSGALITAEYAYEYARQVFAFPYSVGITSGAGCNSLIKKGAYLAESAEDIFAEYNLAYEPAQKIELSETEKKVLEIIRAKGEVFVGKLADKLKMQTYELIPILTMLEMKKLIAPLGGNRYEPV